ncbi:MAG: hypothetical protein WBZ36_04575 [Candidatus Nitrosopolaris sp.]
MDTKACEFICDLIPKGGGSYAQTDTCSYLYHKIILDNTITKINYAD